VAANIDAVANWDNPQGGFDTYIVIGCSQDASGNNIGMGDCNKKIGNDNRKIG
jgi:hypothetical protein